MTVAIVMGSESDLPLMRPAADTLTEFGVDHEVRVVSAHRTPHDMLRFADDAAGRGIQVIVAGAGGAAHLPGMLASATTLPVIGVPLARTALGGTDALHSVVQMPAGIPVATVAVDGAVNAALLAVRILGLGDERIAEQLAQHQEALAERARAMDSRVREAQRSTPPAPR
ncbi:5-(carboxyamino)imidazole ribonucleotide mutase [Nitriliruptor alkaliphilus]|uniref:5-(carboxyamino)imidazole ribonucleotide mutase n=1 Tax=Nitriliruptor alkaliphilus TaxID=427918 RepID=UPI0006971A36|nr:5-(carboxyamino)imidazole ribonucleotide mutase [Nitriliruptor alkaliphilus]